METNLISGVTIMQCRARFRGSLKHDFSADMVLEMLADSGEGVLCSQASKYRQHLSHSRKREK